MSSVALTLDPALTSIWLTSTWPALADACSIVALLTPALTLAPASTSIWL
eukprot:CAMPEP_0175930400 /NCGR_PEP_ID=MMETSP0108-20121206/18282_1 /TAXON_ID=195067 ORGANISM="Goniomonas pacifica, Strain CCMP1869" /NCGR_SAMPLE_ID=MMETSP0108 /ASSEMBLY_ACC=CAM_ASM_000204 /LENGTH=49 /DNA_ID= /DNA_START= /DNA_END= /DNA_ORIENTATION=